MPRVPEAREPAAGSVAGPADARSTRQAHPDNIGERLFEIRQSHGLRVTELARTVGVTPSLISQIERGQSRPSVATLFALARALGVPVDAFFGDEPRQARDGRGWSEPAATRVGGRLAELAPSRYLVRRGERATLEVAGGVRWERLTAASLEGLEFLELVYAPHAESNPELYRHPGVEMVVVLEGSLDITIGFERYELGPGDSLAFPSSLPHRYTNPREQTARAVTVILRDDLSALH